MVIILGVQLYIFFGSLSSPQEDSNNSKVTLDSLNKALEILQSGSTDITNYLQEFKNPMSSLNRYLSGGTRAGVVGEWGLEAIVSEVLASNQYEKDYQIIPNSGNRVEFAIKMPEGLLMPVDSKFHSGLLDKYERYIETSEMGEDGAKQLENIRKEILDSVKTDAQGIKDKYMQEGVTVDIGIMFVMSESLMQLIDSPDFRKRNKNTGIREEIFNEYRVLIMGPNSFAAYLTSVYMGFKTLSINEKTRKVIEDIGKARKEFNKFSDSTKKLIKRAEELLNRAIEQETRERALNRVLEKIETEDDVSQNGDENNTKV